MVWIECDDAVFEHHFKKVHKKFIVSSGKNINSASKVVNWIIVDILKYVSLLTLCYHWQSFIWGATNMYTNTDHFILLALHVQGNN